MARSLRLSIIDLAEKRKSPVTLVPSEPLLVGRDPREAAHQAPGSGPTSKHRKITVRSHYISASQLEIWMDEDAFVIN